MMTSTPSDETPRRERLFRILDALANLPAGKRRAGIRTLSMRLTAREERLLLALVAIWQQSGEAAFAPPVEPHPLNSPDGITITRPFDWPHDDGPGAA